MYLLVPVNQDNAQRGRDQLPAATDRHVVPQTDVVDVHGDRGVGADAVALHQRDQLGLGEVLGRRSLLFDHLRLGDGQLVALLEVGHGFFTLERLPREDGRVTRLEGRHAVHGELLVADHGLQRG